ncbi:hypothetical protein PR202_ga17802 [Eleusine coracana subsp. coracana]|uniref:Peptidase A1 domain-containing protein n=1 Tax=Eleusine coracana subsp. coracana TaxID=191504 RepID=A0AAV5CQB7_ELECO|nr:hypothetical protein PR202_ga17802 [Eleusine coracana subsp. coracana]
MLDEPGKSSPVFLGGTQDDLSAHATGPVQSTPMPPHGNSTLYYSRVQGHHRRQDAAAGRRVGVRLQGRRHGRDVHRLRHGPHQLSQGRVRQTCHRAFKTHIHLPVVDASEVGGRLCFSLPDGTDEKKVPVPKLVFHFAGADMDLPRENYFYVFEADAFMCLMILSNAEGDDTTTIGNFQQQNMHIVYDVQNNKLLFAPAQCDKAVISHIRDALRAVLHASCNMLPPVF